MFGDDIDRPLPNAAELKQDGLVEVSGDAKLAEADRDNNVAENYGESVFAEADMANTSAYAELEGGWKDHEAAGYNQK